MPKPGPRTTYKYSDHFKATAVRLSYVPGVQVRDVADSLYIHPFMLSRWRKELREGKIVAKGADVDKEVAGELKELRRIKKDYERLTRWAIHSTLVRGSTSNPKVIRYLRESLTL